MSDETPSVRDSEPTCASSVINLLAPSRSCRRGAINGGLLGDLHREDAPCIDIPTPPPRFQTRSSLEDKQENITHVCNLHRTYKLAALGAAAGQPTMVCSLAAA
jgi:hypothetical protein